ncbi:ABC transporter substrate-binding protein [Rhizobium sp. AN63]|uniref:ABC transporter substrate-binding protein n=1 Tax=Rhizobium sp. AN63 TaxID=3035210 RepID=UPI0027D3ECB7|nr:ABC transporter substrate-binding protein [Rhizobium sp. AN63]MDQ4408657.1 ABC transporter substrate-binding protein [Rhizobium sp. AN63]
MIAHNGGYRSPEAYRLWAEELSAGSGFVAGDGKTYSIEVSGYDNVCYAAGDELRAARRAILDDGVHLLLQTFTPSCRQALGPLSNETKSLITAYGGGFLSKDFPFLVGGHTGQPMANMLAISHMIEKHPNAKRVAIITTDSSFASAARAYVQAGCAVHADKVEIVYDNSFGATATNDMLGLLTPVAEANPDIIYEGGLAPGQKAAMISTMEQLGFQGIYGSETWEIGFIEQAGMLPAVAGRLFSSPAIDAQEPSFSPRAHAFYKRYVERFGAAEWASWASSAYATMVGLEIGLKAAPAVDAESILKTLYGMSSIDHPLFGQSKWGGEEIFGANHHLYTPQPIYGVNADGSPSISGIIQTSEWWSQHKEIALPALAAAGQVYAK